MSTFYVHYETVRTRTFECAYVHIYVNIYSNVDVHVTRRVLQSMSMSTSVYSDVCLCLNLRLHLRMRPCRCSPSCGKTSRLRNDPVIPFFTDHDWASFSCFTRLQNWSPTFFRIYLDISRVRISLTGRGRKSD